MKQKKFFHLQRWLVVCFLALVGIVALPGHSQAAVFHAQYDHSNPPANARFPEGQSPTSVQVWFTESIEPAFSQLEVYNQARERIDLQDSKAAPGTENSLVIGLQPNLPDGPYTVIFRNVSREDGHAVTGNFSFAVGNIALPTGNSGLSQALTIDDNFNAWSIVLRWLNYIGVALLCGSVVFFLFIWKPLRKRWQTTFKATDIDQVDQLFQRRLTSLLLLALGIIALGWLAFVGYQATVVSGRALGEALSNGAVVTLLTRSYFGTTWLIRLGLILLGFLFWFGGRFKTGRLPTWTYLVLLLLSLGIMFTTSLNSHAAARKDLALFLIPVDLIHQTATGFWIGALLAFALAIPLVYRHLQAGTGDRTRFFAVLLPRFSMVAIISVVLLVVTGLFQGIIQLGSLSALFGSAYGIALLVKVGIFAVLLGFGAFHLLKVSPDLRLYALEDDEEEGAQSIAAGKLQRTFLRTLRLEALIAVVLILSVGVLTSLSPPPPVSDVSSNGGPLLRNGQFADMKYALSINPGTIGVNTIEVVLTDQAGKPVEAKTVLVRLTMLEMDMGIQEVELQAVEGQPGHYRATTETLSMLGQWRLALVVRRAGMDDAITSITLTVAIPTNKAGG